MGEQPVLTPFYPESQLIDGHVALAAGQAHLQQILRQVLQAQTEAAVPGPAPLPADLPVLADEVLAVTGQRHAGHGHKAHVLQQPQLIGAARQDIAVIAGLVHVLIEACGPLVEQLPAAVVEGLGRFAVGGVGVDGLGVVPDRLQQGVEVDAVQHGLHRRVLVVRPGDAGVVQLADSVLQRINLVHEKNLLKIIFPAVFSAYRAGYGPQ